MERGNDYIHHLICYMLVVQYPIWLTMSGADRGGGVSRVWTPPFGPRCRLFNIEPKAGPPFLRGDLSWTPSLSKILYPPYMYGSEELELETEVKIC